jgi:hypothetical protein
MITIAILGIGAVAVTMHLWQRYRARRYDEHPDASQEANHQINELDGLTSDMERDR